MPAGTSPGPPRVAVLMSTYNGEPFVVEQLNSILAQLPPEGRVLVRDDGSRDHTVALIEGLGDPRVSVCRGSNLGFGASFLTLLCNAPADADVVMFADQDDVWLPGKVARACRALEGLGPQPALYGSAQMLADSQLRPLGATRAWTQAPSFRGALAENIITGCTAALNAAAVRCLQRAGLAPGVHFHDWWMYLVVSAFGRVVFDPEPTLLYRQHGSNQIGHGAGWLGRQLHKVRFLVRHDWVSILLGQVQCLHRHYGTELDPSARQLLTRHFRFDGTLASPRWRLILSPERWRETDEAAFRLMLAAHKLGLWPRRRRRGAAHRGH